MSDSKNIRELAGNPTAEVLRRLFELAKEWNKVILIKQRADVPQIMRSVRQGERPMFLSIDKQYFISVGLVKGIGVFLKIELRGKGMSPKSVYFKTERTGLTPEELANQLSNYNVRLRELDPLLQFEEGKRGKKLKGLKATPLMKASGTSDRAARQRRKVPGKDVSLDEPMSLDPAQFERSPTGGLRFRRGKYDKSEVSYKTDPSELAHLLLTRRCGICKYFEKPSSCVVVLGSIKSTGWCRLWTGIHESDPVMQAGKRYAALMDLYGDMIDQQEKDYFGDDVE